MSAFDNSLAEYLTQSLGEEDENDISRKKTCKLTTAQRKALSKHYKKKQWQNSQIKEWDFWLKSLFIYLQIK